MSVEIKYEHILIGEDKVPIISGTNMKVVELIEEQFAFGWSPEELHFQHPYLSMGQIYSALAYYWDNKEEIEKAIDKRLKFSDKLRSASSQSELAEKLKAKGIK
jgi:uncharacterized protein (DUF433 family)